MRFHLPARPWAACLRTRALLIPLSMLGAPALGAVPEPGEGPPTVGASGGDEPLTATSQDGWHGRFELRRENVDRGTTDETTKTYVRSDNFLWGGILSLQVPFPDEKTDFEGSPFNPKLGDIKARYRFAAFPVGGFGLSYFAEATFPTADPAELGSGKYQLSAGMTTTTAVPAPGAMRASHLLTFITQLQQTNSVAGDSDRTDINYTKLDFSLRDTWGKYSMKVAVNTRVDWQQNGKTGAVGELEFGRTFLDHWRTWLMVGGLLWGEGVKATYGSKVLIGIDRRF